MTLVRVVSVFGRVALLVVLVGSGAYVLLYLARWEWQRAQLAGVFFLASLVTLATTVVLRRLSRIEQRLGGRSMVGTDLIGPTRNPVDPPEPFRWLEPSASTHVFLPVLLGFGVALSLLASLAERLVAYAVGDGGPSVARSASTSRRRSRGLAALLSSLLLAAAIGTGWVATELVTRPDVHVAGTRTYVIEVHGRRVASDPQAATEALAGVCVLRVHEAELVVEEVHANGPDTATLTIRPILGRFATARFDGCLNDLVLDRRTTRVLDVIEQPDPLPVVAAR